MDKNIEILKLDGCTESEAKRHLQEGTIIYEDFERNFDLYMKEWDCESGQVTIFRKMIQTKQPARDWGVVEYQGEWYYIAYCL